MCVKRDSFRHRGISVPLGSLLGFAVIIVPSMRKGGKRLWFDCRKMWTLIKLPYANTDVRCSFPAHSKRMPGEGVGEEGLCLGFWCLEIGVFFPPLPRGKDVQGSAFLWKSVQGSLSPLKPGWAVACTASIAEFLPCWTCSLPPFPLPLSFPPSRIPTLQVCVSKESSPVWALSAGREQAVCWKACVSWAKAVLFLLHFFSALERYFYLLITKGRLNNWEYV